MKSRRVWLSVAAMLCAAGMVSGASTNLTLNSAISISRQFYVLAPTPALQSALCVFAERIKQEWRSRLEIDNKWHDPIVLVIRERTGSNVIAAAAALGIVQVGPILKYEVRCYVPPPLDETTIAAAIVQSLCLEMINRDRTEGASLSSITTTIPCWLTQGLTQSICGRSDWLLGVARRSATAARPPDAVDVMRVTTLPADVADRDLYGANTWLLTEGLLRLPKGAQKLRRFLAELSHARSAEDAFSVVYGSDFPDQAALEKWWSLQQARLSTVAVAQSFTTRETMRRLDALLVINGELPFNHLEQYSEQQWLRQMLPEWMAELQGLSSRSHPLYRPVLQAYMEAAQLLAVEKVSRYRAAVRRADKLRAVVDRQAQEIGEILDRAERAYGGEAGTNAFQGYFHTLEQLEKFERQRRNPISDYLDKFDR